LTEGILRAALAGLTVEELQLPGSDGVLDAFPPGLHTSLQKSLEAQGFQGLYAHQAQAAGALMAGRDVILVTGTSSGKTLAYALPALQALLAEPLARALFIYPTKALAQDQLVKLKELAGDNGPLAAVYDGDTPKSHRSAIRGEAQIILTNPDMLHVGILPQHELWRKMLRSLRLVVIDEAHTLRGVFGSHAAWVIRRLLRLAEWHGARPRVAAATATVPNPDELFCNLTGRRALVVDQDTAPRGRKTLFLAAPPPQEDPEEAAFSPNRLAARILAALAQEGKRSLVFCRSRTGTELVVRHGRKDLADRGLDPAWLDSYRGGYTPKERRQIEKAFFKGKLRGLASTNAMELGVDVGGLDAVVINGYPGSVASFWQQAGRTGRGGREGSVVYIPHEDALEHHLLRHPQALFAGSEPAIISLTNPSILEGQLLCAAFERPISPSELSPAETQAADSLAAGGQMAFNAGRYFYASYEAPAPRVSIRGAAGAPVLLMDGEQEVGQMEDWRALSSAFPGAVYLHRESSYIVEALDLPGRAARLRASEPGYMTEAMRQTLAEEKAVLNKEEWSWGAGSFSLLEVTTQTVGFRMISLSGGGLLGEQELDLPASTYQTMGAVLDIRTEHLPLDNERSAGILHSLEHLMGASAPLLAGCDPRDLQTAWMQFAPETFGPRVLVFDAVPGGVGLAEQLSRRWPEWLNTCREMAEACPCEQGCPRCLMSSRCECGNQPLDKAGCLDLLDLLLDQMGPRT
jgi:DEAD/DEAH box helicase domain-containing protein